MAARFGHLCGQPAHGDGQLNEAKSKLPAGMGKNTKVTYASKKDKIKVDGGRRR